MGTNSSKEAQEYFANLKNHTMDMTWSGKPSSDSIELAFAKNKVEDRKKWLLEYNPEVTQLVDFRAKSLDYKDFVSGEGEK